MIKVVLVCYMIEGKVDLNTLILLSGVRFGIQSVHAFLGGLG